MTRLVRAELLKLATTRDLWWTLAATLPLSAALVAVTITSPSGPGGAPLGTGAGVRSVMAAASTGSLMLLLLGIAAMAGEFRHGTAVSTFLACPDRRRLFLAKLGATVLAGLAVGLAAAVVTLAVGLPWLRAEGVDLGAHAGAVAGSLLGSVAVTALAGAIGVGLGALARNQTTAVALALVWTVAVESVVAGLAPELFRWLPGGAFAAVTGSRSLGATLAPGAGLMLSLGYAAAFAAAGRAALVRRDIAA
ncbi:MAG TPA: hypothetical protein VF533_00960 [Solirubrobacteraceae bacterium]|jgi:ABC-2 type transport system permease protein